VRNAASVDIRPTWPYDGRLFLVKLDGPSLRTADANISGKLAITIKIEALASTERKWGLIKGVRKLEHNRGHIEKVSKGY